MYVINNLLAAIEKGILQSGGQFLSISPFIVPGLTTYEIQRVFHKCIGMFGYFNIEIIGYYGSIDDLKILFIDSKKSLHQYNYFENEVLTIHMEPFDNIEEVTQFLSNQVFTVYRDGKKCADVINGEWIFTDNTEIEIEIIEASLDEIW